MGGDAVLCYCVQVHEQCLWVRWPPRTASVGRFACAWGIYVCLVARNLDWPQRVVVAGICFWWMLRMRLGHFWMPDGSQLGRPTEKGVRQHLFPLDDPSAVRAFLYV